MPPSKTTRPAPTVLYGLTLVLLAARIGSGLWESKHPVVHDLVRWHSLAKAEDARPSKKALLYVFGASWCEPCKRMESELFDDPKYAEYISRRFVAVHIDSDAQGSEPLVQALRSRYEVKELPTPIVVPTDPKQRKGTQIHKGYLSASELQHFLADAPTIP